MRETMDSEVFTSAYWHPKVKRMVLSGEAVAVGITLYPNKQDYGYALEDRIMELAPNRALFRLNEREDFEVPFKRYLDTTWFHAEERLKEVERNNPGKAILLLCFDKVSENPKDWCHRTIVGDFIQEKTGKEVNELAVAVSPQARLF
jgi:hypothetical protein